MNSVGVGDSLWTYALVIFALSACIFFGIGKEHINALMRIEAI